MGYSQEDTIMRRQLWNAILLTTVTAAMLEVLLVHQCNVVNLRVLTNCCVWNYTPVEKHSLWITLA